MRPMGVFGKNTSAGLFSPQRTQRHRGNASSLNSDPTLPRHLTDCRERILPSPTVRANHNQHQTLSSRAERRRAQRDGVESRDLVYSMNIKPCHPERNDVERSETEWSRGTLCFAHSRKVPPLGLKPSVGMTMRARIGSADLWNAIRG